MLGFLQNSAVNKNGFAGRWRAASDVGVVTWKGRTAVTDVRFMDGASLDFF
jgi:hypothetical protein